MIDSQDAENFVMELYEHLLKRPPQPKEKEIWVSQLLGGKPEVALFRTFIRSKEYKSKSRVKSAYPAGHYYSPIVDPEAARAYVNNISRVAPGLDNIQFDDGEMRRFWKENLDVIQSTPFSDEPSP